MQRMHQSYKCMKARQKKLSGCASNLLAHEDLGHLRKPIVGIYKPSSVMKNSHQYMKVTTQKTPYHEDHGATMKHKCGKRIVTFPLLSFSLCFSFFFFLFFGPSLFWHFLSFFIPLPYFQYGEDIYAHPCFQAFPKQFTVDYLSNHLYGQEARKVFIHTHGSIVTPSMPLYLPCVGAQHRGITALKAMSQDG